MARRPRQLDLPRTSTWGGARKGAGRKLPTDRRAKVQHRRRPEHRAAFPVHVTLRARRHIPSLRLERTFAAVRTAIACSSDAAFRVLHFSIQSDHTHLIVEADTSPALSVGIAALKIRAARGINRALGRRGAVWADRYHARALRTPREVRAGLVYVLQNWKKHIRHAHGLDGRSSAAWFDGWAEPPLRPATFSPVVPPRTWLATIGWRRRTVGPLRKDEAPQSGPDGPLI
jgi:REP element-mobilizing transposase RayT